MRQCGVMNTPELTAETLEAIGGVEGRGRYSLAEAADLTGLDALDVAEVWAAMGRAVSAPDEVLVSDLDLRLMRNVGELSRFVDGDSGSVPAGLLRTLRTAAHSLRRVSEAHVTALAEALGPEPVGSDALIEVAARSGAPMRDVLMDLWTGAVTESVAAVVSESVDPGNPSFAVGFVDLSGFTARSQQLETVELAELVERFDRVTGEVLAGRGATLVKTIGDEAMFVHRDPAAAAWTALELVERCGADELLVSARGGVSWGRPLRLGGDYYGPSVNLASRLVQLAVPGGVLIDDALAAELAGEAGLELVPMRPQRLRGCGRRRIHVARRITVQAQGASMGSGARSR